MDNIVCDFMHDIPEGVARYDMAVIINHLITNKYFTLDILNKRIELFNYGETERKNTCNETKTPSRDKSPLRTYQLPRRALAQ